MVIKSIAKLMLTFSACFLCAAVLGAVGLNKGLLSPRGLGIFLAVLCLSSLVFLVVKFRRLAREHRAQDLTADFTRERRVFLIRMYKGWIAVLALCLVGGIVKETSVHPIPWGPMLVGITMNLLTTWTLVLAIRKLQRGLNQTAQGGAPPSAVH